MQSERSFATGLCGLILTSIGTIAPAVQTVEPDYVGSQVCASCHQQAFDAWQGSDHDLAMSEPGEETVLGDFADAEFTAYGVTSRFFRQDGGWYVRTDGPDGALHDYRIAYTFGWYPLQQYLIEFPGGKLQALGIAWDSRPREQGGQHWFHLYPNETDMGAGHPLHWTARDQTWNYQCAECHSTKLDKHYDLAADSYATTWAEIDVACEACHGPGAEHATQAKAVAGGDPSAWSEDKGLAIGLTDRDGGAWSIAPDTGLPRRSVPRTDHRKIELCARCHARRGQIHAHYEHGLPLGNTHQLALLDAGLYYADGQILDEVYVYGSFIQSKMYRAGVTCTDCHDAHSLKLKADGDLVCAQCHSVRRYAAEAHHHHQPNSEGASCVGCHMPQRFYMVNDERADHGMRIPRPDLSITLGTPNACNQCHQDQSAPWAAAAVADWYGDDLRQRHHFGEALQAGRTGAPDAAARLLALATDGEQPGIARATALDLLQRYPEQNQLAPVTALLADADPLVRQSAVRWLEVTEPRTRFQLGMPLLDDRVRTVRLEAARTLAPLMRFDLPDADRQRLESALQAYRNAQLVNAERPESHLNMGLVAMQQGKLPLARKDYLTALRLDPGFVPAYANLADLYRALGADADGEQTLKDGLRVAPDSADLHHALGLLYIRAKRLDAAVDELARAARLAPDNARYAYVHALALKETGDTEAALAVLTDAYQRNPADRDTLLALVTMNRDAGHLDDARGYAQALRLRYPDDPEIAALARALLQ